MFLNFGGENGESGKTLDFVLCREFWVRLCTQKDVEISGCT